MIYNSSIDKKQRTYDQFHHLNSSPEIQQMKYEHYTLKREQRIALIRKYILFNQKCNRTSGSNSSNRSFMSYNEAPSNIIYQAITNEKAHKKIEMMKTTSHFYQRSTSEQKNQSKLENARKRYKDLQLQNERERKNVLHQSEIKVSEKSLKLCAYLNQKRERAKSYNSASNQIYQKHKMVYKL
jgi:hypothetical protein